jgi:hypothetical protein
MMKIFRQHTRLIIWLIVISFIAWGGGAMLTSGDLLSPYAGEVFGKKIKTRDFERQKKLLKLMLPIEYSNLPSEVLDAETLKQLALAIKARQEGLKISDEDVRRSVEGMLGPVDAGDFRQYERWTKQVLNEDPRDFEESLRNALLARQYSQTLLQEAGIKPPQGLEGLSEEEKQKRLEEYQREQSGVLKQFFLTADIKRRSKT